VKSVFGSLRSRLGKVGPPASTDPITQLILGVLSRDAPETKAHEGLERLRGTVVDYNELRVIPPIELAQALHDFPDGRLKCEDISRALNVIFAVEHTVSLDRVAALPKKDSLAYLERVDGLEAYTRARIRLLGFRHHAIPLDEAMWACARAARMIDARCPLVEAQQFLERQISEDDALEFVALLKRHAWSELGAAVRKREVERIRSVPPDRTTRNMLQMITGGGTLALSGAAAHPPAELAGHGVEPGLPDDEVEFPQAPRSSKRPPTRTRTETTPSPVAPARKTATKPSRPAATAAAKFTSPPRKPAKGVAATRGRKDARRAARKTKTA
jgi:hypothetical protein